MNTMKRIMLAACCGLLLAAGTVWAVDYSKMSNEELSAKRGTLYNASTEEWHAFHTEWWKRLSQMTPEERQKYIGPGKGCGMGYGKGRGRGMGCGPCWGGPGPGGQAPTGAPAGPAAK